MLSSAGGNGQKSVKAYKANNKNCLGTRLSSFSSFYKRRFTLSCSPKGTCAVALTVANACACVLASVRAPHDESRDDFSTQAFGGNYSKPASERSWQFRNAQHFFALFNSWVLGLNHLFPITHSYFSDKIPTEYDYEERKRIATPHQQPLKPCLIRLLVLLFLSASSLGKQWKTIRNFLFTCVKDKLTTNS